MGQPPIASSSWAKNPRPDENPKPSAHHEKPYSAWALRLFVPCIRILLLLVFVPCIRILLLLVVVPWGCDFKGCDFKGCGLKGCDFKGCDLNPKPSARMNPKPSAHHEKPYSAWALRLFVPCTRILLLLVFVPCIRILLLLVVVPWGCDFKGCDLKGCDFKGCDLKNHLKTI